MHVKSTLYEKQQPFFPNNGERVLTAGPAWLMASRISPRISPAPCERDERDMEESKNRHEVVTSLDLGGENQRGKRWEEEINPKA